MSFVRDFAMAGNCGENPMNSFLSNVDKSTSQLDLWQRDFRAFEQENQQQLIPHGFEEGFLGPNNLRGNEFDEFEEYERVWENPRPEFNVNEFDDLSEVNPIINNLLHDFLNFSASNKILPPKQIEEQELQLSIQEVDKIVERSGSIARHFCATQNNYQLMTRQLHNLFQSLNIHVDPRDLLNRQSMGDWERDFQSFQGPQLNHLKFNQFNKVWEQEHRNMNRMNEWRDDYQKNWSNYKGPVLSQEDEQLFNKAYNDQAWVDEFKQEEDNERAEEEEWFSKFISPKSGNQNSNNSWVNEFNGRSNTGIPWVDEFNNNNQTDEFNSLTDMVSEIPIEKLQNSNFVKFVNQVKNKEVVLPDLQMKVMED